MKENEQSHILILPLSNIHKTNKFKSGDAEFQPLKTFIQRDAISDQHQKISQTYVAIDDRERVDKSIPINIFPFTIIGYISVTCGQLTLTHVKKYDTEQFKRYQFLPAIKIARLAIDARRRSDGIGSILLDHALSVVINDICPKVGCRFVVTDAKKSAIDFYRKRGMVMLQTATNQLSSRPVMLIDLYTFFDASAVETYA